MPWVPVELPLRTPMNAAVWVLRLESSILRHVSVVIDAMVDTSERMLDSKQPCIVREQCICGSSTEDVLAGLSRAFDVALQVEDNKLKNLEDSSLDENGCNDMTVTTMGEKSKDLEHVKAASIISPAHSVKCLCECSTFPMNGCIYSTSTDIIDNRQEDTSYKHTMSLPLVRKVISAMRGGREKEGLPPRMLNVSWAPDVDDPPPSSVSHLPRRNNQSYRNSKKYVKGKQKSKSSQGSRKKDKKHHHRKGGEPSLGLAFVSGKTLQSNYKPSMELHNFDNGEKCDSPDSNCGSSFLKKSCGSIHITYAETT
ncbi:hypothetical protein V2J09_004260 [Rumex salicifolius]